MRVTACGHVAQRIAINSNVFTELNYTKASSTFHSWKDQAQKTYGLNFQTQNDADTFARGIADAIGKLKGAC